MVIKLDIDGVLRDMITPMCKIYNEMFGTKMTPADVFDYDIDVSFPLFTENGMNGYWVLFEKCSDLTMTSAKPYRGVAGAVRNLKKAGNKIVIVSYQPSAQAQEKTREWLERNKIEYDELVFVETKDKTVVPCDMIIDDCPWYLDAESDDVKKICISHAYNKDCKALHFPSLASFAKLVEAFGFC